MRTPDFWRRRGLTSTALLPVSVLYRAAHRARIKGIAAKAMPVPIVCVGNLTAGGAGKTPAVIALLTCLHAKGVMAHCISRGYGGVLYGPVRVDPNEHTAAAVGDEPLLIARHAPCWVGKRRLSVATASVLDGAKFIVMDDGLQNPSLKKDLNLLVVDGGYGFGNRRTLPSGPLRETLSEGLAKVHAVVVVGDDAQDIARLLPPSMPILRASLQPAPAALAWAGKRVLAFAGIGRPDKFFATLRELGAELVETASFADHHPYREEEIRKLLARASDLDASVLTTEKDAVRLPPSLAAQIGVLPVHLVFADEAAFESLLAPLLAEV